MLGNNGQLLNSIPSLEFSKINQINHSSVPSKGVEEGSAEVGIDVLLDVTLLCSFETESEFI